MTSKPAERYLREYLPLQEIVSPSAMEIEAFRQQIRQDCEPGIQSILNEFTPQLVESEIAGIPCLEVTAPKNTEPTNATMLYFFGGGFVTGSPEEDLPISVVLSHALGIKVVCPRYPLGPESVFPAAMRAGFEIYNAIVDSMNDGKLLLCGESAGGNLALSTLIEANKRNLPLPSGIALLSPWADLSNSGDSLTANNGRDPFLGGKWVDDAASMFAPDMDLTAPEISPLFAEIPADTPPTIITTGSRDLLLSHCLLLAQKMRKQGIHVDLRVWENMWHVFEWYPDIPEARQSLLEISDFLGNCLN